MCLNFGFSGQNLFKNWVFRTNFFKKLDFQVKICQPFGFQLNILGLQVKIRLKLGVSGKELSKNSVFRTTIFKTWVPRSKSLGFQIKILSFYVKICVMLAFQVEICRNSGLWCPNLWVFSYEITALVMR